MELGLVLGGLPVLTDPDILVGTQERDDAAVYRIAPDRALVATVDFFTPIVDDPRAFGTIAAANSLSDVYAMGGSPMFALSLVAFPRALLESGMLQEIVAGGAAKLAEGGVPVVGGHSVDDAEPKFGYAVIGEVHPDHLVSVSGAQPGNVLYLTKPLGSGLVATAVKRGLCPQALEERTVVMMTHLNRAASQAMLAAGCTAATDVTGYGLVGHLLNMEIGAELEPDVIPVLDGVRELAARDLFPSGSRRNWDAYRDSVDWDDLPEVEQMLFCDAQTSGGLLVAIPQDRAAGFEEALAGEPYPAARIGIVSGDGHVRFHK